MEKPVFNFGETERREGRRERERLKKPTNKIKYVDPDLNKPTIKRHFETIGENCT